MTRYRFLAFAIFLLLAAAVRPAPALGLAEDISREFDYIDGLVNQGRDTGHLVLFDKAHRTLANLGVTAQKLDTPTDETLVYLSIAYFYVRMCEVLPMLQLSTTTNPEGYNIDCVAESGQYFKKALDAAEAGLVNSAFADTHFYVGLGYDALSGYLAEIPGSDTAALFNKAREHIARAAELGTSFPGAKTVLAQFPASGSVSDRPIIDRNTFLQIHRMFYMDRMFPQTPGFSTSMESAPVKQLPENEKQMYMDYRWRFSIQKPDDSWDFATSTTKTNLKLTAFQKPGAATLRPSLTLVAHLLTDQDQNLTLSDLVKKSTDLLTSAGYVVESRKDDIKYHDFSASEIVLTYSYADLGIKPEENSGEQTSSLDTKHYMFIVLANGIEYILSFTTLRKDYPAQFPDLKMIANTFTPF